MNKPFLKFVKEEMGDNFLMITTGLPATWKTETSEEVVKIKGTPMLRSDIIRLEVLKGKDIFDEKVASNMNNRLSVYDEVFRRADETLKKSGSAILDATFITQELRKRAAEIADKNNKTLIILQTDCPQEVSVQRILKRTKEKYESNALTEQAYLNNKTKFEKVDLDDIKKSFPNLKIMHLIVDTTKGIAESLGLKAIDKRA
ncbi:MAG: ATP-binding protein [Dehalococcoidales bacterium]|nr:ATP-binding protein [Dehalococcoidales bacterium]